MKRQQALLIVATVGLSWLGMQAVHELGHVIATIVSGGRVNRVVLRPETFSFTQVGRNPHPLFVVWMGPIVGSVLPLIVAAIARRLRSRGWYVLQFFAGFCLITNGAYIAFGSVGNIGDAGDMLCHGSPEYLLWLFGAITIPVGLRLWNGLGRYFGLGTNAELVDKNVACTTAALFLCFIAAELLWGGK